ncbi:hypothetical protein EYZ11_007050 [Aspergillus tanneri]|uniref:Transcription factor domain-containing protein n=1 Tax=Aspergillus tanneri TaxID=1220188 RepID=A0A4S3JEF1_9EURO|nr:uncharacterized protein ATNIH1004_005212 [Aspergillus tanneri]KAA8649311.1 hypothetical protein ATNIH1004_005212 [Aspergillus tanneri]THC93465.1 hypothetical protein EYZ11_007050 [Aspergillus tanneri]
MTNRRERVIAPALAGHSTGSLAIPPRRRNVSRACRKCQTKKTKVRSASAPLRDISSLALAINPDQCTGGVPCQRCRENNDICIVDEEADERRKIVLKRRLESLEHDRKCFLRLVEILQDRDRTNSSNIISLIRSDAASLEEIRLRLAVTHPSTGSSGSPSMCEQIDGDGISRQESVPSTRRKIMDIKRLTDSPLYRVSAHPWTSVTHDNDFVSHLVSLYFSWDHLVLNWIDRDLFIRDMQSGMLNSQFCSPLLVNSVLAVACFYSDWPEAFTIDGDPTSRGFHFLAEAKDLLAREEGRVSLPTLQGLGCIYTSTCIIGKDRLGWKYLVEIGDCARQLAARRSRLVAEARDKMQMDRALNTAVFGLFSLTPTAALTLQKPPVMKKPSLDRKHSPGDHDPGDTWVSYPMRTGPVPAHTNCVTNALFELQLIAWDISNYLFDEPHPYADVEAMVDSFHDRLERWSSRIPQCISVGHETTPAAMDMHMRYHAIVLTIFGFLRNQPDMSEPVISMERARYLRNSSARHIHDIIHSYRSQWPMDCMPMSYMQYVTVALFTLLEDPRAAENHAALVDLCSVLHALACRALLPKGLLRLVQLTAQQKTGLPLEMHNLFRDFESELWTADDRARFSSLYPNFAVTVQGGEGEAELDEVLEKWDTLSFESRGR